MKDIKTSLTSLTANNLEKVPYMPDNQIINRYLAYPKKHFSH